MLALPIFPGSHPPSIVGANELNFCVRDGNRWTLIAINTNSYGWGIPHLLYASPVGLCCRLWKRIISSTTHLAVVWLAFAPSKLTQLNASSFICNLFSPSAVSPLQMTTSAHPVPLPSPSFPQVLSASSGLSAPVSRCLLFLPLPFASLSVRFCLVLDTQLPVLPFSPPSVPPPSGFPNALTFPFVLARSSPFLTPGFPFASLGSAYSALLFVPFRSSLLHSHSRSTGAPASFRFYPSICWFVLASVRSPLSFQSAFPFRSPLFPPVLFRSASTLLRFLRSPSASLPSV